MPGDHREVNVRERADIGSAEAGAARVRPAVAAALVGVFLALIGAGQALQWAGELQPGPGDGVSPWAILGEIAPELGRSEPLNVEAPLGIARRVFQANRIVLGKLREVDDTLDHESVVGRLLRPRAQQVLSGWLGAGNEQAYCGRDGWLFYRTDVEYVTRKGFLDPESLRRRRDEGEEWVSPPQPDPRLAVADFARELQGRGIRLILVPTPVKPSVHPARMASRYERGDTINNPSFAASKEAFVSAGALVFDPLDMLAAPPGAAAILAYLATDTHWRPESMERVAEALADFVETNTPLPGVTDPGYLTENVEVTHFGDIRAMLNLPDGASIYPAETVRIGRVLQQDGTPWRPSRSADVLLLGDSFSNVYSLGSMGWGESAGFAEHLSRALGRPLDRVVQNDDAAYATRMMLRQQSAGPDDRLAGKRVVIYQFAARELAFGDWRIFERPD